MTDTERLDWLSRMLGAAVCELMFKSGLRVPAHGRLRETIDAAAADAARFVPTNQYGKGHVPMSKRGTAGRIKANAILTPEARRENARRKHPGPPKLSGTKRKPKVITWPDAAPPKVGR